MKQAQRRSNQEQIMIKKKMVLRIEEMN